MLEGLKRPLRAGATFPLTLTFRNAGALNIEVRVESPQAAVANATDWPATKVSRGLFLKAGKGANWSGRSGQADDATPRKAAAVTLIRRLKPMSPPSP